MRISTHAESLLIVNCARREKIHIKRTVLLKSDVIFNMNIVQAYVCVLFQCIIDVFITPKLKSVTQVGKRDILSEEVRQNPALNRD